MSIHGLLKGAQIVGLDADKVAALERWAFKGYVSACSGLKQEEKPDARWERTRETAHARDLESVLCRPESQFCQIEETAEELATVLDAVIADPEAVQDKNAVIEQCAKLRHRELLEYEPRRLDIAKALKFRTQVWDAVVGKAAKRLNLFDQDEESGNDTPVKRRVPSAEPVNGGALIEDITATLQRHVVMSKDQALMTALWVLHTYVHDAATYSPLLAIQAATKGAGKTTLLLALYYLVEKPHGVANTTEASIFRRVKLEKPTLLADEADSFVGGEGALRGILNAGFGPRELAYVERCDGDDNRQPTVHSLWAPRALAGIGKLPDTIQDRSLVVHLRRKRKDQPVERLDEEAKERLRTLASNAARWAQDNIRALGETRGDAPEELGNRVGNKWEAMLAIAKVCGRFDEALTTALTIHGRDAEWRDSEDEAITLLRHAKEICDVLDVEYIEPGMLLKCLTSEDGMGVPVRRRDEKDVWDEIEGITEGRWRDCDPFRPGQELTGRRLSQVLKSLEITITKKRLGDRHSPSRCYARDDLREALALYT